jgi:AAA+ ATPase superfamily predicted ATPase
MNVALDQAGQPFVAIDFRGLPYNPSKADLLRKFESGFSGVKRKWWDSLAGVLKGVKGASIAGGGLAFSWETTNRVDLAELFDKVDAWACGEGLRFLAAFDEIQIIRGDKEIPRLFAHVADTNSDVNLIVTGSEVGLLFDFLGFQNPGSPLYGRHYTEITAGRFSESDSMRFLVDGFSQLRVKAPEDVLTYAVEKLDGVAGWLTLFGAKCRELRTCSKDVVEGVVLEAGKLARQEASGLASLSSRYCVVLNYLSAVDRASWKEIKARLEAREARSLTNAAVAATIAGLLKMTFIEKSEDSYRIGDPILRAGLKEEPLPE